MNTAKGMFYSKTRSKSSFVAVILHCTFLYLRRKLQVNIILVITKLFEGGKASLPKKSFEMESFWETLVKGKLFFHNLNIQTKLAEIVPSCP
jgi:hypothetical protein